MGDSRAGHLHHVELWVPDLGRAVESFGWLLESLGYERFQDWEAGRSWRFGPTYVVVEESSAMSGRRHDRLAPGLNHLAFHVSDDREVERLAVEGARHGWALMFTDRHPFAGGPEHYAAYLENADGFEVELVAEIVGATGSGGRLLQSS
ncbi:VOC family protein [Glycomyces dulcitolivorans]|uniref:VOC family protein n=1 Tax=Glycomyces dulcitolivorans TaxID=2200759 RepID=UPI000DD40A08|nr:VOC family protein [Glycomyces dulcitolivorans]